MPKRVTFFVIPYIVFVVKFGIMKSLRGENFINSNAVQEHNWSCQAFIPEHCDIFYPL